jgi:nitroreductase
VNTDQNASPTERIAFLRSLRAVRRFAPTPVPDEVVREILEVGRWTGSSKNTQPWELLVVGDRAMLQSLSKLGQFAGHLAGADFAIGLIMASRGNSFDEGRLCQNLELAAWAHGVGSCIGSIFPAENEERAKVLLGVPPERVLHTMISFGYPADRNALLASSTSTASALPMIGRRPFDEIVHVERYGRHEGSG